MPVLKVSPPHASRRGMPTLTETTFISESDSAGSANDADSEFRIEKLPVPSCAPTPTALPIALASYRIMFRRINGLLDCTAIRKRVSSSLESSQRDLKSL